MNIVIYDLEDLEPITIVDIDRRWFDHMEKHGPYIRFPIHQPLTINVDQILNNPINENPSFKIAEIRFERFRYGEKLKWMAFAVDPALCLLLKSVFLAGQRTAVNDAKKQAVADGFIRGLKFALSHSDE